MVQRRDCTPIIEHARLLNAAPLSDGSRHREQMRYPGDARLNESALTYEIFDDCPTSRYPRYDIKGLLGDVLIAKQIFAIENTDALADRYRHLHIDTCAMKPSFDSIMVVLDCETGESLRGCRCLRSNDGCNSDAGRAARFRSSSRPDTRTSSSSLRATLWSRAATA